MSDNSGKDLFAQNLAIDWECGDDARGVTKTEDMDNSSKSSIAVSIDEDPLLCEALCAAEESGKIIMCGEAPFPHELPVDELTDDNLYEAIMQSDAEASTIEKILEENIEITDPSLSNTGEFQAVEKQCATNVAKECVISEGKELSSLESDVSKEITDPSLSNTGEFQAVEKQCVTTNGVEKCMISEGKELSSLELDGVSKEADSSASETQNQTLGSTIFTKDTKELQVNKSEKCEEVKPSSSQKDENKSGERKGKGKGRKRNSQQAMSKRECKKKRAC